MYLVLQGGGYGCCVGSLTILTPGEDGRPRTVFSAAQYLLDRILPLEDGSGIQLIGKSTDSEARATGNAQVYDPYRIYLVIAGAPARYDLDLSKAYTERH
jgi:hypothetical protein